jgi:hypothetical protein
MSSYANYTVVDCPALSSSDPPHVILPSVILNLNIDIALLILPATNSDVYVIKLIWPVIDAAEYDTAYAGE